MHDEFTPEELERFWSYVDRSGGPDACWPWTGTIRARGYGYFWLRGKSVRAHRLAYRIGRGHIAPDRLVCHECDRPACCNPYHLYVGTNLDNVHDKWQRSRGVRLRGGANGSARLSVLEVEAIRARALVGEATRSIARDYSISDHHVRRIVERKAWVHVD